jgi:phosphate transport system substrate-binding protein
MLIGASQYRNQILSGGRIVKRSFYIVAGLLALVVISMMSACSPPTAMPQPQATEVPTEVPEVVAPTDVPEPVESDSEENPETTQPAPQLLPPVDALSISGDIVTAGSSTVFPLAERMAERFEQEGYQGNITIDSIGSGAGFERFCVEGESDISNASRAIKDSEVEACNEIGRNPVEFRVGTDALAVVVSAENDFVTDVSMEELAAIFSDAAETWSDVRAEWPDEPIQRFIPGTDSGTFDYFVEEVFDKDETPHLSAANTQLSEDDNVLVQGILGSPYAIGYFGYAYYAENEDVLNILSIDGVEPVRENVDNNTYPLARPLFMYSDAAIMQQKPQVAAYLNFFLTYVNEEIVDVGYFPASEEALTNARLGWLEAMGQ